MDVRAANCMNHILPESLVNDMVIDESARKVVMHLASTATTIIGDYHNEYMLKLHMTEDGRKVDVFQEFVDSKYSAEYLARLREVLSQSEKANM
ncbi:MAG: hypothetical protein Q9219_002765 [cf. Caloplaca sp. 3 TL-2023]